MAYQCACGFIAKDDVQIHIHIFEENLRERGLHPDDVRRQYVAVEGSRKQHDWYPEAFTSQLDKPPV